MKEKLIIALDVDSKKTAEEIIEKTKDYAGYYKIGLGFLALDGIAFAEKLVKSGHKIFLDLKLFDIGQTIIHAVQRLSDIGIDILTVHGDPYVVSAALKGRGLSGNEKLDIYAVTVLTSLGENEVLDAGYHLSPDELVLSRARKAALNGADGVIASGHECRKIKSQDMGIKVITPGIRSKGQKNHDQKRVMTPMEAIHAGADHIVIGREITQAPDPQIAAKQIIADLRVTL